MTVIECDRYTWDAFVDSSENGTVFHKSSFVKSYGKNTVFLLCKHESAISGGIAIIIENNSIISPPLTPFSGVLFGKQTSHKIYKCNEMHFATTNAIAEHLFTRYTNITIINHHTVNDIRPFSWLNYHNRADGYYEVEVFYTSEVSCSHFFTHQWSDRRKRNLARATRLGMQSSISDDLSLLNMLRDKTFERQGITPEQSASNFVIPVCSTVLDQHDGFIAITSLDGHPVSASFFCIDNNRAYYLIGATDPNYRDTGCGTKNISDAIEIAHKDFGAEKIDFVGVNSPQRGEFKLSFGGDILPYYKVTKITKDQIRKGTINVQPSCR